MALNSANAARPTEERQAPVNPQQSKQALAHHLAWGTCPAQSHSNLTYTNAGGISEYLRFSPLVRRPGAPRLAARQRPIHLHSRGRPAASPAGACDARRLRRVLLGARRRLSPAAGQVFLPDCRRRCCYHRRRQRRLPVGSRRSGRSWRRGGATCLLAVGGAQHGALLHDLGPSRSLR